MAFKNLRAQIEEEFAGYSSEGDDDFDVFRRLEVTGGGRESALKGRLADAGFSVEVAKIRSTHRSGHRKYTEEELAVLLDPSVPPAVAALRVGVCTQTVFYRRKHGRPRKNGPKPLHLRVKWGSDEFWILKRDYVSAPQAAKLLGVDRATVIRARKVMGVVYHPARASAWDRLSESQKQAMLDRSLSNNEVSRAAKLSRTFVYEHRDPVSREVFKDGKRPVKRSRTSAADVTREQLKFIKNPHYTSAEVQRITGLTRAVVEARRKGLRPRGRRKKDAK